MILNGKDKNIYLQTKVWKDFRAAILKDRDYTCEFCGIRHHKQLSSHKLNVHHLCPDEYDNLDPEKFRLLCFTCHEFVEFMILRINGVKYKPPVLFDQVFNGLRPFLTHEAVWKGEILKEAKK